MTLRNIAARCALYLSMISLLALMTAGSAQAASISAAEIVSTWTKVGVYHPYGTSGTPLVSDINGELMLYGGGGVVAPTGFSGPYTLSFDVRNPSISGSFGAFFGYQSNEQQFRLGMESSRFGTGDFPGVGGVANAADGRVHGMHVIKESANGGDVNIGLNTFLDTESLYATRHQPYHVVIDRQANGDATVSVTGTGINYTQTFAGANVPDNATLGFYSYNAGNGVYFSNIELVQPVPEPSTMALGGLAFVGLIGFAVRNRRKAAKANAAA